jgi:hypothetical protein
MRYLDTWHRPQQSLMRKRFQDAWHRSGETDIFGTPAAHAYGSSPAPEDPYGNLLLQRNILLALVLFLITILLTFTPTREAMRRRMRRMARRMGKKSSGKRGKHSDERPFTSSRLMLLLLLTGLAVLVFGKSESAFAETTVPRKHVYHGHLLTSGGATVTTPTTIRFSEWKSADAVPADVVLGIINTSASNYAGWQEVHTVTPNSQGYFSVTLGSITPLPDMSTMATSTLLDLFLQVEVKPSGAPDLTYDLLDENPGDPAVDRPPVLSVPFALNADLLDKHDTGTASGSIAVLGSGGLLPVSTIPAGTNKEIFALNADGSEESSIGLQFGSTIANMFSFDIANDRFNFNDDVRIQGNLTVTENLSSSGSLFIETNASIGGTLSGASAITFSALKNCNTIDTDANGVLSCGTDDTGSSGLSFTNAQGIYVNQSGDTMTGNLIIGNSATLSVSGSIVTETNLTMNEDNGAADASFTFGNDAGAETLKFSDTFNEFEFSDDLRITGNLSASGSVSFDGATSFNNVQYTWPGSAATASGKLLSVDPSTGKLSWTSGSASSGSIVWLKPTYPNATYFGSGASKVGTLSALHNSGSSINYYRWQTTKTTAQQYWIATQVRIPNNFRSWDPVKPIQFSYRGSGGSLNVKLLDTNDANVSLTGGSGLAGASWQTATITGPESGGTFTADDYMTFLLKMTASGSGLNNEFADAGFIELNWETKD